MISFKKTYIVFLLFINVSNTFSQINCELALGGNAWIKDRILGAEIKKEGLVNWTKKEAICKVYFRVNTPKKINISAKVKSNNTKSKIKITVLGKAQTFDINGTTTEIKLGNFDFKNEGYYTIQIEGIEKKGEYFGEIESINLGYNGAEDDLSFVKSNENDFFYWGRRGPSSHLSYIITADSAVEYFYNEVTVPKGSDVLGSYFMANGFSFGYFGMQVIPSGERRILFSVWSPNKAENPKDIPEDEKIKLISKGNGVYVGEFGFEGAGSQSYLTYNWKTETSYKFLLKAKPVNNNCTDFTAYFFDVENNKWILIATFSRPKTVSYLVGLYSFLENLDPETGNIERKGFYGNQWIRTVSGDWVEIEKANYFIDNTGSIGYRRDHVGGVINNSFYLKAMGFFNKTMPKGTQLIRKKTNTKPIVNLSQLPKN